MNNLYCFCRRLGKLSDSAEATNCPQLPWLLSQEAVKKNLSHGNRHAPIFPLAIPKSGDLAVCVLCNSVRLRGARRNTTTQAYYYASSNVRNEGHSAARPSRQTLVTGSLGRAVRCVATRASNRSQTTLVGWERRKVQLASATCSICAAAENFWLVTNTEQEWKPGLRSRRFLGGVGFLTTLGQKNPSPTPDVQFLLNILLKQRFLAVHHGFHWF